MKQTGSTTTNITDTNLTGANSIHRLTPASVTMPEQSSGLSLKIPAGGFFVAIEGGEGAGKSLLVKSLQIALTQHLHTEDLQDETAKVVFTREPGGTELGKLIRQLILAPSPKPSPLAELFLFAADRAEHCQRVIQPALAEGALVVCDRFSDSTKVYQGAARGISMEIVCQLDSLATSGLKPDLVLLLDLPPEIGLARAHARTSAVSPGSCRSNAITPVGDIGVCNERRDSLGDGLSSGLSHGLSSADNSAQQDSWNRFEEEQIGFHQQLRKGFLDIALASPQSYEIIDAQQKPEAILAQALSRLSDMLSAKGKSNTNNL